MVAHQARIGSDLVYFVRCIEWNRLCHVCILRNTDDNTNNHLVLHSLNGFSNRSNRLTSTTPNATYRRSTDAAQYLP